MTTQEIRERVIQIVSRQLELGKDKIEDSSNVAEDLGADSLDLAEIMMDMEDEFDVTISDEEIKGVKTVGEAVTFIEKLLAAQ